MVSSLPVVVELSMVLFAVGLVAWPIVHGLLLWEGMKVFGGERRALGPVVVATLFTPIAVFSAGLAVSFVGSVFGLGGFAFGASVLVAVAARTLCYRAILGLETQPAFGLGLGVSILSWAWGVGMTGIALFGTWMILA